MNLAQKIVVLAAAVVIAGVLLFGEQPFRSSWSRVNAPVGSDIASGERIEQSYGPGLNRSAYWILATVVMGGALVAVLHRRKRPKNEQKQEA